MKSPRKNKTETVAKNPPAGHNSGIDPEQQALFLTHKSAYQRVLEKFKKAQADVRNVGKTIKADGFTLRQVKLAVDLDEPEGEAVLKMAIANDLLVARWMNCDVGQQMDMFMEPSRVPAADRAYSEGQKCSMENRAAVPPYDPSTQQHARFMAGFHDHQASIIQKGIKKLEAKPTAKIGPKPKAKQASEAPKKRGRPPGSGKKAASEPEKPTDAPRLITAQEKADRAKALADARERDTAPPKKPAAVEPVTRAILAKAKADAKETAESYFSRSADAKGNA